MRATEFITESTGQVIGPFKLIDVNNSIVTVEGHKPLKLSASVQDRLRPGYNYAFDIVNGEVAKVILMVVDAVIYTDTEVLLIKRKGEPYAGHWALPGGFVEPGESVADAAKRELQEETGLVVNNVQPVGEFKTPNRDPRMENTWSYAFKLHLKDRGVVHAGDDASAASWIPREQLSKLPLAFDHSAILAKALTLDEQVQPELTNGEGFEHTVDRNGITLKAASNGHGALQIKAFVQGKKAGEAYFEMTPDNQHIASDDTHVDQRFRRTGIATVMYQYAKELGNSIAPSPDRTDDGNAMWLGFMRKNSMIDEAPLPPDWDEKQYQPGSSFKSRLAYALDRAKKLGAGSSRVAVTIEYQGRPTVLKIAKNTRGLGQNGAEASVLNDGYARQMGILIPLIDYDKQNPEPTWIQTELAQRASKKQLCAIMKCDTLVQLVAMARAIKGVGKYQQNYADFVKSRLTHKSEQDIETMTEYADKVADLDSQFGVLISDLSREANWGIYQGEPVIIDVGYTSNVSKQYYSR